MERTYFIYRYIRHDKNVPFYIGRGTRHDVSHTGSINYSSRSIYYRAYSKDRNKTCLGIMAKTGYDVEIIYETTDINHAEEKEKEFIQLYGIIYDNTGTLTNLTKGGVSFKTTDQYVKNHHFACRRAGKEFARKRAVHMYDLDGTFIESFKTVKGFSDKYGYGKNSRAYLSQAINRKVSYKGYFFSTLLFEKLDTSQYKSIDLNRHPIVQYKQGVAVNIFNTPNEIEKYLNISSNEVYKIVTSGKELPSGDLFVKTKIHLLPKIQIDAAH